MQDVDDVCYPTWNGYMDQLQHYQATHGAEPPNQQEIYAACIAGNDCLWYLDLRPETRAAHDARRRTLGLTWDAYLTLLLARDA